MPRDRLLLVPDNQGVGLALVSRPAHSTHADLLSDCSWDISVEVLSHADDRDLVLKRHAAYLEFYGDWLSEPQPPPWWQRRIELRIQRLHMAELDSAWVAMGGSQD